MKRNVFLWGLYDFANTPLTVAITGLYLAQWIVLDNHLPDIWYGGTFVFSTILLLITSPFWGAWSDKLGRRMPFLAWTTIIIIIFGLLLAFTATSSFPVMTKVLTVLFLFLIIQYFYQISLIFYDSLLIQLSTPETRGKISGIGRVFGESGWFFGPAILLPFANGTITLFGSPGRSQVFLPAVILLVLLGLPMIFWFKESRTKIRVQKGNFREIYTKTIHGFKDLIKNERNVAIFLVAFMLVSDAILTATLFFAIYLDQVYKVNDTQKVILLALAQVVAITSAYVIGRISDKKGIKNMLIFSCSALILGYSLIALSSSLLFLYAFVLLIGLGVGGFYPTSRALLVKLSPSDRLGEYFGFYATFERFASIIGPLVWGITTFLLKDYGEIKYRVALMLLICLMIMGTLFLTSVKENREDLV